MEMRQGGENNEEASCGLMCHLPWIYIPAVILFQPFSTWNESEERDKKAERAG